MDRRNFLQIVSSAFIAAGLPAVSDADSNPLFGGQPIKWHGLDFKRTTMFNDYANLIGVCVETNDNGHRQRLATQFLTDDWMAMNAIQQESVWLQLEFSLSQRI